MTPLPFKGLILTGKTVLG